MRKLLLVSSLLTLFLMAYYSAFAQQDPQAKQILDAVKKKYQDMPAYKVEFTYNMSSPTSGVNETVNGSIVVKGSKFYLKLPEQEIITNGSTQWTYLKESNEVNISDYEPDEDDITPDKIYTIYERDYDYSFVEDKVEDGKSYEIIDLKPKDRNAQFFKIRLKVVKDTKSLKSWEMYERNANRYLYEVHHFATVKVGDSYFKFNPTKYPSNPEVIDLR